MTETTTVRDRLHSQLDGEIHAITITKRRADAVYAVVARTTEDGARETVDIRTVVVDLDAEQVRPTDNGIWIPADLGAVEGVMRGLGRTHNDLRDRGSESPDPLVSSAVNNVDGDLLLDREIEADSYQGVEWGDSWGNGEGPPPEIDSLVDRLREAGVATDRFSRLNFGDKAPWERYANRTSDELLGNYGVEILPSREAPSGDDPDGATYREGRDDDDLDGLVVIDVDDPDRAPVDAIEALGSTFAVTSPHGSDERAHHYLVVDDKAALLDHFGSGAVKPGWGDVWISGEYVVGPGCYLDGCSKEHCDSCSTAEGGRYRTVVDEPIRELSSTELIDLLDDDEQDVGAEQPQTEEREIERPDDQDDEPQLVDCHECGASVPDEETALLDLGDGPQYYCGGCS